ncbi:MAG: RNA methyltransferase [Blastocatellia bacterium]
MLITSPANERLKHARHVRDGREPGLIFIEGERLIEECLQSRLPLSACFHSQQPSQRAHAILNQMAQRGCPSFAVTDAALAAVSDTVSTQGLILIASRPSMTLDQVLSNLDSKVPLVVCLDALQDPGNFGTIVRTAEAAGASGVVALTGCVDAYAPKTLRSAMGSAFRLPIATNVSPEKLLSKARAAGLKVVTAAMEAEVTYTNFDWRQPAIMILGNEATGARAELLTQCDTRVGIPLCLPVESLNAAAAAAVLLFEAVKQRA